MNAISISQTIEQHLSWNAVRTNNFMYSITYRGLKISIGETIFNQIESIGFFILLKAGTEIFSTPNCKNRGSFSIMTGSTL